jgi:hypothetical protein
MKWSAAWVALLIVFLSACSDIGTTYEKSKENIIEKEQDDPLKFLSIEGHDKRNFFGQTVVKATITNSATMCTYNKVRIKMLYYNKEGVQVTNHEEVLDKAVSPKSNVNFKAKYFTPKGTDSVALSIMSAEAVAKKQ